MAPTPENREPFEVAAQAGARREINVTPGHVPPPLAPPSPPPPIPAETRPWYARVPRLTPARIAIAFAVAGLTDVLQFALGPLGWVGIDQALDVMAMIASVLTLGFHPLLLPTVVLEAVPLLDAAPTWIACVAIVVALRKRAQRS